MLWMNEVEEFLLSIEDSKDLHEVEYFIKVDA